VLAEVTGQLLAGRYGVVMEDSPESIQHSTAAGSTAVDLALRDLDAKADNGVMEDRGAGQANGLRNSVGTKRA
jgi:hypothetical protein